MSLYVLYSELLDLKIAQYQFKVVDVSVLIFFYLDEISQTVGDNKVVSVAIMMHSTSTTLYLSSKDDKVSHLFYISPCVCLYLCKTLAQVNSETAKSID